MLGIPHLSRLIVNEKQQLTKPSSLGASSFPSFFRSDEILIKGLYRNTHEVRTAFWLESNATWPYFCWSEMHAQRIVILTHLPVIDSRLFCHQFVYTEATLPTISDERYIDENSGTHVPHHVPVDTDQLGEFAVSLVYLACSTPKASGHTHC